MNAERTTDRESPLSALCKAMGRERSEAGRSPKRSAMKERKKRDKLGAEKGRRECATQKVQRRASVLEIGPGVSRLITTSGGSDNVVTADRVGAYEYRRLEGEREAAAEGRKEKRPFLRIPKARRRDATTRL